MDLDLIEELHSHFIVRYAKKNDCKNILKLIQELADSLQSSNEASIDVDVLEKYGFDSDPPLYQCLVIEDLSSKCTRSETSTSDNQEIGNNNNPLIAYALYSFSFSSWYGKGLYLEDIYVTKAQRGKKFGTALFKSIAKTALRYQCNNLTMFVFKTNEMKQFFISKGAKNLTVNNGFDYYKIDKQSLMNVAEHLN